MAADESNKSNFMVSLMKPLLIPVLTIGICYGVMKTEINYIKRDITKMQAIDDGLKEALELLATGFENSNKEITSEIKTLSSEMKTALAKVERAVTVQMGDRWTKTDDMIFMREFCLKNKLNMTEHKRTIPTIYNPPVGKNASYMRADDKDI